jgi:transposase
VVPELVAKTKPPDPKLEALRRLRCLNPRPEKVTDSLFASGDFFDPRDLVQVKYEMLRRSQVDGQSISRAAKEFGFSRPAFYEAQAAVQRAGIAGLVPQKRGPRRRHKLGAQVVDFLMLEKQADPSVRSQYLAAQVRERFGVNVHPRSVERALSQAKKKRR